MTHLPSPLVYTGPTSPAGVAQFVPGSSEAIGSSSNVCAFPAFNSIVALEYGTSGMPSSLVINPTNAYAVSNSTAISVTAIMWGAGGGGGYAPMDSPAGNLIGGSGGSGGFTEVKFTLKNNVGSSRFGAMNANGSINFVVNQTNAYISFLDTTPTPPQVKYITAANGISGTPAFYSVSTHMTGNGGSGGGSSFKNPQPIGMSTPGDIVNFLSTAPNGLNWAFSSLQSGGSPSGITPFTVTSVNGPSGHDGTGGGILSPLSTAYNWITDSTAPGSSGFVSGIGGAGGCASKYVVPTRGAGPRMVVRLSRA
jgi:hypothetical protein